MLKLGHELKLHVSPNANPDQEVKAFTPEQLTQFFDAAKQAPMPYGPLFWTLAFTGVRVGEGVALKWSDVDLATSRLHVQRTLSGGVVSTPKSGKGRRVLLSERASRVLHLNR